MLTKKLIIFFVIYILSLQNLNSFTLFFYAVDSLTTTVLRWDLVVFCVAIKYLQGGGTGSMGLINNLRSLMWIRVQQYTTRETKVR